MKKIVSCLTIGITFYSNPLFAANFEKMIGNNEQTYLIDKDSIEKKGQFVQAKVAVEYSKPQVVKSASDGKYNRVEHIMTMDCHNKKSGLTKTTTYLNGKVVFNTFYDDNSMDDDNADMVDFICDKYVK